MAEPNNPQTPPSDVPVPNPLGDLAVTHTAPPTDGPAVPGPLTITRMPEDSRARLTLSGTQFGRDTAPEEPGWPRTSQVPGYEILGVLGRGGMGVVYRARHLKLERLVALKLLPYTDPAATARERFAAEARAVARMQHPNIVQVFEIGEFDGAPFVALELVAGGTLAARVAQNLLPPRDAAALVATLARAVQYAHDAGVVHRDLKPTNILLTESGEPKIADFGLAKELAGDSGLTVSGAVIGTPSYMPPEQARGELAAIGPAADVYALGAILYDLLTGRPPFKGATVAETLQQVTGAEPAAPTGLQPSVPRDLETVCLKCLQKDPARRYASARELAEDLGRYLTGEPIRARPVGARERVWRWCKRNQRVAALLAAVFTLLILVAAGAVVAAVVFRGQNRVIADQRDENARQRDENARQRDEIADREAKVLEQQRIAQRRARAFARAVDGFANEAPAIIDGHPLGSAPLQDLLKLSIRLSREAREEAGEEYFGTGGEMTTYIRQGHLAKTLGRIDEAEKHYEAAFQLAEQNFRTRPSGRHGVHAGNFALLIGQRAGMLRIRAETRAGWNEREKAREMFAEAVKLHHESIALFRRVVNEPEMRDIHIGEARAWLGGGFFELAETHRLSVPAFDTPAEKRAAWEAARAAAKESEAQFAAGLAVDWKDSAHRVERSRLRQALAVHELARAADKLEELAAGSFFAQLTEVCAFRAEADAAYQRCFELFDQLVKDTPKNLLHRINFAKLAADQGYFLMMKLRDGKRAEVAFRAAVEQNRRVGRPPELNHYHSTMGSNLYQQGVAEQYAGDKIRAQELFRRCVAVWEEQLREAIRMSSEKSLYTLYPRIRLMFAQARAGDHARAAAFATELRKDWDKDGDKLSYAAQGFALAAAAPDAGELATAYRDKAFDALTRAVEVGYANVTEIERDPDYDPLRGDPRFAPLVEKARANAEKKK